jgi:hypothetical protein
MCNAISVLSFQISLTLYNCSSEGVRGDCHGCYSSGSGSNLAYYINTGPRYDDTEYSTQSDTYSSKKQINHHRRRKRRAINDRNLGDDHTAKDYFGYIASGDYFLLTTDENSFLGRSESHIGNDSSSEFDYSDIEFVGTKSSDEHNSSETETFRVPEDVDDLKTKHYTLSHSPVQDQQNGKHSVSPSLPNHSTSYRSFMRRNQRHSAFEHNKEVSEETNDNFNHLLPSDNLEYNVAFPFKTNNADNFSFIDSDEDRSTSEDKSWVHSIGTQDVSNKDAKFPETDSFWKENAYDEVNNAFPRHKNTFLDKESGIKESSVYEHPATGLPRDRLKYNEGTDKMLSKDRDVDLESASKQIRNKARNGSKDGIDDFNSNVRHKRVGLYDTQNTKAKHSRKHHHYDAKGTTHEETEEDILDKMDHTSFSPTIHRSLQEDAISMYSKNDTTVNKKQQNFSNKFGRKVTEDQNNKNLNGKSKLHSEVKRETPVTNNGDSKEMDKFTNMYEHKIKINASSTRKRKQLNSLQNKNTLINSNKEQTFVGVSNDPIIPIPNQIHHHNHENSTTDNGTHLSSETNQESKDTDKTNKAWNSTEVKLKIVYPFNSINQHEETINVKNAEYPSYTTEDKSGENELASNYGKTENRSDTVRWKRFETNHKSSNIKLSKAHPWQHEHTVPINTVNEHGSSPGYKSRVTSPCTENAKNREIPFFKQENKLFGKKIHQNTQYLDGRDQDKGELLITDTAKYLHEKDNSTKSVKDSTHPIFHHTNDYHSDLDIKEGTGLDQYSLYSVTYGNNFQTDMKMRDNIYRDISLVQNDKEIKENFPRQSNGVLNSVENDGGYRQGTNNRQEYDLKHQETGNEEGHTTMWISAQNDKEYTREQKSKEMSIPEKANIIDYTAYSYPSRKRNDTLSQQQNMKFKKDAHKIETLTQDTGNIDIYRKTRPRDHLNYLRNNDRPSNDEINIEDNIKDYRSTGFKEASYHPKFHVKIDNTKISDSTPDINKEEVEQYRSTNEETDLEDNIKNYQTIYFKGTHYHPNFQIKARDIKKSDFSPINNEKHVVTENMPPHLFHKFNETYFTKYIPQNVSPYGITPELSNKLFPGNKENLIRSNIRPSIHIKEGKIIEESYYPPASFQQTVSNLPNDNDKISSGTKYRNTDRINHYNSQERRFLESDESILPNSFDKVLAGNKRSWDLRNPHVHKYNSDDFKAIVDTEGELDRLNYGELDKANSRLETEETVSKLPVHFHIYSTNDEGELKPESKSKLELKKHKINTDKEFKIFNEALFPSAFPNVNTKYSQGPDYNLHSQMPHLNKSKSKVNTSEKTEDLLSPELYGDAVQLQIEESISKMLEKYRLADKNISSSNIKNWGHINKKTLNDVKLNDYNAERSHTGINSNADDFKSNEIKFQSKIKLPCKNHKEDSDTGQCINIRKYHSRNNMNVVNHPKTIKYYDKTKKEEEKEPTNVGYKCEGKNAAVQEIIMSLCNKNGKTALTEGFRERVKQSPRRNKVLDVLCMGNYAKKCTARTQENKDCTLSKATADNDAIEIVGQLLRDKAISSYRDNTEAIRMLQKYQEEVKEHDLNKWKSGNMHEDSIRTNGKLVPNHKHESQYNRPTSASEESLLSEKLYNQRHRPLSRNPLDHRFQAEEYQLFENLNGKERHRLESKNPTVREHWKQSKFPLVTKFQKPPSMTANCEADKTDTSYKKNFNQLPNHQRLKVMQGSNEMKHYRDDDDYYYIDNYRQATNTEGHSNHHSNIEPENHSHFENINYNNRRNYANLMTQHKDYTKYTQSDVTKPANNNRQTNNLYEHVGYGDVVDKVLFQNYTSENFWPNNKKHSYENFVEQHPEENYFSDPDETEEQSSGHFNHETNPSARDYIYTVNPLKFDNYQHKGKKTQQNHGHQKADLYNMYSMKDDRELEEHKHIVAANMKQRATTYVQQETKEKATKRQGFNADSEVTKSSFEDRLHTQGNHFNEGNYSDKESIKTDTQPRKFDKINSSGTKHDVRKSLLGESQTTHALQFKLGDITSITEDSYQKKRDHTNIIKLKHDSGVDAHISKPHHDSGADNIHETTKDINIILNARQPKFCAKKHNEDVIGHYHKHGDDDATVRHDAKYYSELINSDEIKQERNRIIDAKYDEKGEYNTETKECKIISYHPHKCQDSGNQNLKQPIHFPTDNYKIIQDIYTKRSKEPKRSPTDIHIESHKTNTKPKYPFLSEVDKHKFKHREGHTALSKHSTNYPSTIHPHEHAKYKEASSMYNKKSEQYNSYKSPHVTVQYFPAHYRHYEQYYPSEKWDLHESRRRSHRSHEAYPRDTPDSNVELETQIQSPYVPDEY